MTGKLYEEMTFPDTWDEYEDIYGFKNESNDSMLIQCFRVRQWLDHIRGDKQAEWIEEKGKIPKCPRCGIYSDDADQGYDNYCPNCGLTFRKWVGYE